MSNSEEEEIARDYICFEKNDCTVIVVDATRLERNLNLVKQIAEMTDNIVICVNLLDEAAKKGIKIKLDVLEKELGVPVVGIIARKKKTLKELTNVIENVCKKEIKPVPKITKYEQNVENAIKKLQNEIEKQVKNNKKSRWISIKLLEGNEKIINKIEQKFNIKISKTNIQVAKQDLKSSKDDFTSTIIETIMKDVELICKKVVALKTNNYNERDRKIDKILTSKLLGIPIMIIFLGIIFWITVTGANYPSEALSAFFTNIENKLMDLCIEWNVPNWVSGVFIAGMYRTATWVISVMLPPMAIFFPLFVLLEDLGYLPRIAFNLDNIFRKARNNWKASSYNVYGIWM